jgi:two-component system, LuxR family, sensor kinase FixL
MSATHPASLLGHGPVRSWLLAIGYVAAFLLLDWASYIRPLQGLNITPWNPQPALAISLLMWRPRWLWLVWLGLAVAEFSVRGVPGNMLGAFAASVALSLAYAAMAQALVRHVGLVAPFRARGGLLWFAAIVCIGSLVGAVLYVLAFSAPRFELGADTSGAIARYAVGEVVGLMVTLPVLLIAMDHSRRPALAATLRSPEWWAAAALTCICLLVVFGRGQQDYFKYFYLLLLPVVWASARFGLPGAVLSAMFTQLGLIVGAELALEQDLTLFELQALMAASALTALLLGMLVDERARAAAELRSSLRFAAAGQMAAALAHELSQPLTALSNYAQVCRMLAGGDRALDPAQRRQLVQTVDSLSSEALRAGDVIKRLRDFFRTGATSLRELVPQGTIEEAVQAHTEYAQRQGVMVQTELAPGLPAVWMDPIQIGVVLRNLMTNAIESASAGSGGMVLVRSTLAGRSVLVEIRDSGPGLEVTQLQHLFDAGPSTKQGGMGVGLSICRAIVEAHGGKLWAEAGPGGRFFFTLPIDEHETRTAEHAS